MVAEGSLTACPGCGAVVNPEQFSKTLLSAESEFCECGCRVTSSVKARAAFDNMGFEYLKQGTSA